MFPLFCLFVHPDNSLRTFFRTYIWFTRLFCLLIIRIQFVIKKKLLCIGGRLSYLQIYVFFFFFFLTLLRATIFRWQERPTTLEVVTTTTSGPRKQSREDMTPRVRLESDSESRRNRRCQHTIWGWQTLTTLRGGGKSTKERRVGFQ